MHCVRFCAAGQQLDNLIQCNFSLKKISVNRLWTYLSIYTSKVIISWDNFISLFLSIQKVSWYFPKRLPENNSFRYYPSGCPRCYTSRTERKYIIGPSGVLALPLAAGINVVAIVLGKRSGHSTWHYFSLSLLSSESLTFLLERRQLGLWNFAWAPKSHKY
jgi:hypothetical protein